MCHWFDEFTKGVAERSPWATVLRQTLHASQDEEETTKIGTPISRRAAVAGVVSAAVVGLMERLASPATADGARARRVNAKPCQNHEDLKNGLRRAPEKDYFEGVACTQLEAMKVAAARYCDRFCRQGSCPNAGERCVPIAMGGTPAFKNECDLVNSGMACKGNPGGQAYACRYKLITQCTCLCKAVT